MHPTPPTTGLGQPTNAFGQPTQAPETFGCLRWNSKVVVWYSDELLPGHTLHEHTCTWCGVAYKHAHVVEDEENEHAQRQYQCPNPRCESFILAGPARRHYTIFKPARVSTHGHGGLSVDTVDVITTDPKARNGRMGHEVFNNCKSSTPEALQRRYDFIKSYCAQFAFKVACNLPRGINYVWVHTYSFQLNGTVTSHKRLVTNHPATQQPASVSYSIIFQ